MHVPQHEEGEERHEDREQEVVPHVLEQIGRLAHAMAVPQSRVRAIVQGKRAITGDTALRLGHWFGTSPQFWLNLQSQYDAWEAARKPAVAKVTLLRRPEATAA